MTFAWPWIALFLPVIFLAKFKPSSTLQAYSLEHPYLAELGHAPEHQSVSRVGKVLQASIWVLLIIALMRPQWVGEPIVNNERGRSLYLAVDISESMLERDMQWNGRAVERYQAVQAVVGEFIEQRDEDFIGLVVFGSFAAVQAPLTADTEAIKNILADLRPGMADGRTAIGDGLALAVKQLRESDTPDRVVILLSDGESNSGSVTPAQATQVAQQSDIKVYTIGFGGDGRQSIFGRLGFGGNGVDEQTLQNIASQTGGTYFRATSAQELSNVFNEIETLEPSDRDSATQRVVIEWYWCPLLLALALIVSQQILKRALRRAS